MMDHKDQDLIFKYSKRQTIGLILTFITFDLLFYWFYEKYFNEGLTMESLSTNVIKIKAVFWFFPIMMIYSSLCLFKTISINQKGLTFTTAFSQKYVLFKQIYKYENYYRYFSRGGSINVLRIHYRKHNINEKIDIELGFDNLDQLNQYIIDHIQHAEIKNIEMIYKFANTYESKISINSFIILNISAIIYLLYLLRC